ncbi:hypothetical protein ACOSQ3_009791 [Xanthoceras sorbifolium]
MDPTWYVDSGVTNHMITSDLGVPIIDSHSSPRTPIYLNNILHVPSITKNLVSISQFTKVNNVIAEFNSNVCSIKDKNSRKVMLQGGLKNGIYQRDLLTAAPKIFNKPPSSIISPQLAASF